MTARLRILKLPDAAPPVVLDSAEAAVQYVPRTMRAELPDEADEALDFDALVAVLDELAGDDVCADVEIGDARLGSRFAASGSLRRIAGPGGLPTFAVGDLFVLVLDRADFHEARLRTEDGHSFYWVSMAFGAVHLTLADVGSAGLDYQGY